MMGARGWGMYTFPNLHSAVIFILPTVFRIFCSNGQWLFLNIMKLTYAFANSPPKWFLLLQLVACVSRGDREAVSSKMLGG